MLPIYALIISIYVLISFQRTLHFANFLVKQDCVNLSYLSPYID